MAETGVIPDLAAIRARDTSRYQRIEVAPLDDAIEDRRILLAYVDALVAAASQVTCVWCNGSGRSINQRTHLHEPCPHCGDLRALLPEEGT